MCEKLGFPVLKLSGILQKEDPMYSVQLAEDEQTPADILAALAYHNDVRVRSAVVDNRNAPIVTLYKLAGDESLDIRYQLAENHRTPARILLVLAGDENPYIRVRANWTLGRLRDVQQTA